MLLSRNAPRFVFGHRSGVEPFLAHKTLPRALRGDRGGPLGAPVFGVDVPAPPTAWGSAPVEIILLLERTVGEIWLRFYAYRG